MASTFKIISHEIPGQHIRDYPMSTRRGRKQEHVFKLAVKQYVPLNRPDPIPEGAITILGFHGNGFPKETYEPLFEDLCNRLHSQGVYVRGVWLMDICNQGASGVLNEHVLGDQTSWHDHSRDVLHMVNHFREEMPRPIIGLAHSFGCNQLVHLSMLHPRLISTVILIEPIIFDPENFPAEGTSAVASTSRRRDIWPSYEAASKVFRKAFAFWDPRSVEAYLKYGLHQIPTAAYDNTNKEAENSTGKLASKEQAALQREHTTPRPVTLTTTKAQEAWSYAQTNFFPPVYHPTDPLGKKWNRLVRPDQNPQSEWPLQLARPELAIVMRELPHLRPSCFYVFGGNSPGVSPQLGQDQKMAATGTAQGGSGGVLENKVKKYVVEKASHLVTFEKHSLPVLVEACAGWIQEWFETWLEDERMTEEYLARPDHRPSDMQSLRLSDQFIEVAQKGYGLLRPGPGTKAAVSEADGKSKSKL